jgi:hypothetical protein
MRLTGILLLCCLPMQSALADETNLTLTVDRVTYSNVTFGTVTPSSVSFRHSTGAASMPLEKLPPELQKKFGYDPQKAAEYRIAEQEARRKAEAQARQASQQREYAETRSAMERLKRNINWYIGDDRDVIERIIDLGDVFISALDAGDAEKTEAALRNLKEVWSKVIESKPVYGYQYNEFVRQEVTKPITFGLYTDSSAFYIAVGDGDFRTVATVPVEELLAMMEQLPKVFRWMDQCQKEHLETTKEVGRWGGVSFEFVSEKKGDLCYLWLAASGAWGKDRLLEESKVRLSMMNFQCLLNRIQKAPEIAKRKLKSIGDAERLK